MIQKEGESREIFPDFNSFSSRFLSIYSLFHFYLKNLWAMADPDLQVRVGGGGRHPDSGITGAGSKNNFFGPSGLILV